MEKKWLLYIYLICLCFRISLLNDGGLKIANVTKADAGTYTCMAENQFGKANGTTHLVVTGRSISKILLYIRIHYKMYYYEESNYVFHNVQYTMKVEPVFALMLFLTGESQGNNISLAQHNVHQATH